VHAFWHRASEEREIGTLVADLDLRLGADFAPASVSVAVERPQNLRLRRTTHDVRGRKNQPFTVRETPYEDARA
jgi:hypothetical protein